MQHLMNGVIDQRVAYTMAHHFQCLIDTFSQYSMEDQSGKLNHASFYYIDLFVIKSYQ